MHIKYRDNHSRQKFFLSTFSAQIHLIGALAMGLGAIPLLNLAANFGPLHFWASFSFIFSGVVLFLISAVYHFIADGFEASQKFHEIFENLDHFCIYLFIAGTYSPFLLTAMAPRFRLPLIAGIWALAFIGITYTLIKPRLPRLLQHRFVYTAIFFCMGAAFFLGGNEAFKVLSPESIRFLLLGCLSYTIGAVVYATKFPVLKKEIFGYHELWHALVLFGAISHYAMVYSFYLA